jgi:hypothetical protein
MTLSLNPVVDIEVYISPLAAPRRTFDQGLIAGNSTIIPVSERIRQYTDVASILEDGFNSTSPEYLAAVKYFGQSPNATYLWLGRWDTVASKISTCAANNAGTGYAANDVLSVVQGNATGGQIKVLTVGANGTIATSEIHEAGTGYANGTGLALTGGSGNNATLDITDIRAETALESFTECRGAGSDWYMGSIIGANNTDLAAIAAYVEAATPSTAFAFQSNDANTLLGTTGNIFDTMKGLGYNRTIGLYSNTAYADAALIGRAMGLNTGLANSAFTLKFKDLTGITADSLTNTQVTNIEADYGNVYINRGDYYDMLEQGKMAGGSFFDEILFLDMLVNNIQLNVMDLLYQVPKVPQTDAGVSEIIHQVNRACDDSVDVGFIAPGVWTGVTVLNLKNGDALPNGYLVQAQAIKDQSTANREARIAPPIYCAIKLAGAVHSCVIGVYVNR